MQEKAPSKAALTLTNPVSPMSTRRQQSRDIRRSAAELAASRPHPRHENNGEEFLYRDPDTGKPTYLASFTKGLPHDAKGYLDLSGEEDPYALFVLGIQSGNVADFRRTPLGPPAYAREVGRAHHEEVTGTGDGAIDYSAVWESGFAQAFVPDASAPDKRGARVRAWESAGAGHTFDLQGPDAQAVTMPPAPRLAPSPNRPGTVGEDDRITKEEELTAELAEVYLMALLRDVPWTYFNGQTALAGKPDGFALVPCRPEGEEPADPFDDAAAADLEQRERHDGCEPLGPNEARELVAYASSRLGALGWFSDMRERLDPPARLRHRTGVTTQNLFRGLAPGDAVGPYLSQFLLVGNEHLVGAHRVWDGYVQYGALRVDQRVRTATPCKDYMTSRDVWLDVQNGADLRGAETYLKKGQNSRRPSFRFMSTPRDLATYVHYDALYEAYLNACLLMLSLKIPFDRGIPFQVADNVDKQQGFAHFGGPHILSLVTEVATRALKAVRYQKFNVHRRARPEAIAGWIDLYKNDVAEAGGRLEYLRPIVDALGEEGDSESILSRIRAHNEQQNGRKDTIPHVGDQVKRSSGASYLLPMAYPEGSPMHPAYGAGHATVAGACVTVLKAYFDHGYPLSTKLGGVYEARPDGQELLRWKATGDAPVPLLTVEGELNKLAANIAIGRDWAGVHYYTDYIESVRMGEQIALGILEEQKLTYGENFQMTVPLFNGDVVRI